MRQENQGKRHAQVNMMKQFYKDDYDIILTVDSDSVFDLDAVEHLMRCFSDDRVMASTAMIYTANWRNNLMTGSPTSTCRSRRCRCGCCARGWASSRPRRGPSRSTARG